VRCVYQAYDHADAEIVAGLLRAEGCIAFVFENGLSRLKWYQVIAFGGLRVMVPDACFAQALEVLDHWRHGDYRLDCDDQCPRCDCTDIEENPNYRGWAFFLGSLLGLPLWPALKWRERCRACGYRWKAVLPGTYAAMGMLVAPSETPADDG
jgi:Putative prokaryotic signal transducing protein